MLLKFPDTFVCINHFPHFFYVCCPSYLY